MPTLGLPETMDPRVIMCLWEALSKPGPAAPQRPTTALVRLLVGSGWASYVQVEGLIAATDPRPISFMGLTVRELLAAYGIPLQWTYPRPRYGDDGGFGVEMVTVADLGHLLILLEATGFAIDPSPLCEAIRPQLRTRAHLTSAEIAVWWHAKGRRTASAVLGAIPEGSRRFPTRTLVGMDGFRADLFRATDGTPVAIRIPAPRRRSPRAGHALSAQENLRAHPDP